MAGGFAQIAGIGLFFHTMWSRTRPVESALCEANGERFERDVQLADPQGALSVSATDDRLRPRPSDRFAGAEHELDLPAALRALRSEAKPGANGHRQIALMHQGPVRLVLFAFETHGRIPDHAAPGWVTIHALRGTLRVRTSQSVHVLHEGTLLSLAPDVVHDVEAMDEADMLLGIYPEAPSRA